jgi:hypothetical protein
MPDQLPLTEDQLGQWWSEVKAADAARAAWEPWWDANLKAYAPISSDDPKKYGANVNTNRDFALVEQKKAQLFFHSPEVTIKPSPLMEGQEDVLQIHQHLLNEYLGVDRVNAKGMMDRVVFDIACAAGFGITKMGYESVVVQVEQALPVPDPMTGAPAVDPMTGQPMTVPQQVPVPIWERVFWEHVSPKKVLIPASFHDTEYDKAPWLGTRFSRPRREALRAYGLTVEDEAVAGTRDEYRFTHGATDDDGDEMVEGVEIWYRAALYDDAVVHPERLRYLVLIEGRENPVVHKDSPYQTVDPKTGGLTPDSLRGFPIHICTMRVLTDASYLPSDCTVTRPQVNELNKFREQQIKMRDSNIPLRIVNVDVIPREEFERAIQHTDSGDFLFLPGEAFAGEHIRELAKATYPRENLAFEEKQDNDIARTHAIDSNQQGAQSNTARTATELQLVQTNANVRLEKERAAVVDWYCQGVTKFSTLIQRFVSVEEAATIVGAPKAQQWAQVMKAVPAALAFTARPDSAIRTDAAQDRKMALDLYSFLAKEPFINRGELLKGLLRKFDLEAAKVLLTPEQMPKKEPEPPRIQIVVKGEDFAAPQAPVMVELLRAAGITLSPTALQATAQLTALMAMAPGGAQTQTQTEHGGMAEQSEPLTKHPPDSRMQGTAHTAPIGPGGAGLQ